jgi:hypothetical protein
MASKKRSVHPGCSVKAAAEREQAGERATALANILLGEF